MPSTPIEPNAAQRAALSEAVSSFVSDFIAGRDDSAVSFDPPDPNLINELLVGPSESGVDIDVLLDKLARATDTGFDTASGRHLSYIPSGGLYTAALGSFLGSAINRYTGGAHAAPGAVAIEESVIRWMASLFGMPETAGGLLLSGGSIANLTAMVAARSQLGEDFHDGVVYTSERAHHSIAKAARIAGIAADRVRLIPTDADLRLDPAALSHAISADREDGLRAMMIAATAGTTDTGAIDPLAACADAAQSTGAWFHVDAAYGGFFQLTVRGRSRLHGIDRADSITIDAHKSLFLPFGVGGLLVKDPATLAEAHEGRGSYMQDVVDNELPHYLELGPELTRPNRGLPVWLALNVHGVGQFRVTLDHMLDLAEHAAERLVQIPGIELAGSPELSVVAFRAVDGDAKTQHVFEVLNGSRTVHVSSTTINDRFFVRLAFLSQRTTVEVADCAVDLVNKAMASL